jgi:hypothetical protein
MRPCWIQYGRRLLTTGGCSLRLRVGGSGRPRYARAGPITMSVIARAIRSLIRSGSRESQRISARGRPNTALGWNIWPRRSEIVDSRRALAASTARSQPELPAPTVSTRVPSRSSIERYAPEWICLPVNVPG